MNHDYGHDHQTENGEVYGPAKLKRDPRRQRNHQCQLQHFSPFRGMFLEMRKENLAETGKAAHDG